MIIHHSRPTIGAAEKKACLDVLNSLHLAQGKKVQLFEQRFSRYAGREHGVAVSSGTTALQLALYALGIKTRDEVIIPSYVCIALLHAIDFVGAKPVVVDIDGEDFNVSPQAIKKKISRRTKAVIVPHIFGRAAKVKEIAKLGIPVIEDGTQALGAKANGKRVGSFGVISIFSFYATKMMTTGEGGMILTNSTKLKNLFQDLRDYDKKTNYRYRTNSKMTDLEAAMGIEQLKKLPEMVRSRRKIANQYNKALKDEVGIPVATRERDHVYFRYVVRVPSSAKYVRLLTKQGIEAKSPIFKPIHRYLGLKDKDYPMTMQALKQACSLPVFPNLKASEVNRVCKVF